MLLLRNAAEKTCRLHRRGQTQLRCSFGLLYINRVLCSCSELRSDFQKFVVHRSIISVPFYRLHLVPNPYGSSNYRSNTYHCWYKYLNMVLFRAATSRAAAQALSSQCLRAQISPVACRQLPFKYSQLSRGLTTSSNRKVKVLAVLYEVSIFVNPLLSTGKLKAYYSPKREVHSVHLLLTIN